MTYYLFKSHIKIQLKSYTSKIKSSCSQMILSWFKLNHLDLPITGIAISMVLLLLLYICVLEYAGIASSTCQASPRRDSRPSLSILPVEQNSTRCSSRSFTTRCHSTSTTGRSCNIAGSGNLPSDGSSTAVVTLVTDWNVMVQELHFISFIYATDYLGKQ